MFNIDLNDAVSDTYLPIGRQQAMTKEIKAGTIHKKMSDQKQQTEKKKNILKRLVGYEWIVKNLLFFLFLTLLAVLYIANGHMADNTVRDINKTAKEVKDLQYQYKTLKSEEIFKSRESAIVEAATPLGLQISQDKPIPLVSDEKQ